MLHLPAKDQPSGLTTATSRPEELNDCQPLAELAMSGAYLVSLRAQSGGCQTDGVRDSLSAAGRFGNEMPNHDRHIQT